MPELVNRHIGVHFLNQPVGNTYLDGIDKLSGSLGRYPDSLSIFVGFDLDYPGKAGSTKPHTDYDRAVTVYGMDLLVGIQPSIGYYATGISAQPYAPRWATFADIIAGVYDTQLTAIVQHFCALRKPDGSVPTIRFRHLWEGNQTFSLWFPADAPSKPAGMQATGTDGATGYPLLSTVSGRPWTNDAGDPMCASVAQYKAAWDHMADVIHAAASNAKTVYCPGCTDARAEMDRGSSGATAKNMLPTLAKIDIVGWDSYCGLSQKWTTAAHTLMGIRLNDLVTSSLLTQYGVTVNRGTGAQTGYDSAYDMFLTIAPGKPMLVGETNACEPGDRLGGPVGAFSKADYYTSAWGLGSSWCPEIQYVNWFNAKGTRDTWPFDSSTPAFEAFVAGFTQRVGTSTWRAAPAWVPPDDGDFAPAAAKYITTDPIKREGGAAAAISTVLGWLRSITYMDTSGKVGLRAKGDGSTAALRVSAAMGTLPLGQYIPALDVIGPVVTAGSRKILLALRELGDAAPRWQVRSDGRQSWTTGTGSSDLNLFRSSAGVLGVTGASDAAAAVNVDTAQVSKAQLVDLSSSPASPGTGQAYLFVKGGALRLKTALQELQIGRQPQAEAAYGDWEAWTDRALLSTSTSGPQPSAAGTALCTLVTISSARTLASLATYIQTAGAGLSGCYLAAYLASDGSLLAYTDDRASSWQSTGYKAVSGGNFTAAQAVSNAPAKVWLLAWCVTASTLPRFLGLGSSGAGDGAPVKRFGTLTGMTGTPPASITVGSIAASGAAPWIGVL